MKEKFIRQSLSDLLMEKCCGNEFEACVLFAFVAELL